MKQIPLTQGKFAMVDDEDFEYIMQWKWYACKCKRTYYAYRTQWGEKPKRISIHRLINKTPEGLDTDHIDNDGLNCQKSNLRTCTTSQNNANRRSQRGSTSKYLGVCKESKRNKWRASIRPMKKEYFLGRFNTEVEAALVYNEAALKHFGAFAKINII